MNMIHKTLTITAYALLLTAGQTALAESATGSAMGTSAKVFGGPAIVLASTPTYLEAPKTTVTYADLNLESEEDVRVLYRRVQRASSDVCLRGSLWRSHIMKARQLGLVPPRPSRQCYREALSSAVDKIDNEDLTRFHAR